MNRMQKRFIDYGANNKKDLNDFELNFIESLQDKPMDYPISPDQNKVINKIHQKLHAKRRT